MMNREKKFNLKEKKPLLLKSMNYEHHHHLNEKNRFRSNSEPSNNYFSGSIFISDIWKKVLKGSHIEKNYLKGSIIREEEDLEVSREISYFSNISEDIRKILQSTGNSFLHARKNSAGSNSFRSSVNNDAKLENYLLNSLKIDKAIISNNNIENENNGKEIWLNNEETKRNAIDKFKNNDPFYQKNMIDFLSFVNSPLVKLINSQASNNNKNEETGNNLTTAIDEEFSINKAKNAKHMARDQQGSKLLQKWISFNNKNIINEIFLNIKSDFLELMIDPFGNYLCQKILGLVQPEDVSFVAKKIADKIVKISHNQHGTRSIQKLIEVLKDEKTITLLGDFLKFDLVNMAKDVNGNHVVQKCLSHWSPHQNQFIFESFMIKCVELCCNEIGCRVIQKCLEIGTQDQKVDLITLIVANTIALVSNQFGNYVILRILELKEKEMQAFKKDIADIVSDCEGLSIFITHKYTSKVIEKCLELHDPIFEEKITVQLTTDSFLPVFFSDRFANYVVQSALNNCSEANKERILQKIVQNSKAIRSHEFGNMIYQKLSITFPFLNTGDYLGAENIKTMPYTFPPYNLSNSLKGNKPLKKENENKKNSYKKF